MPYEQWQREEQARGCAKGCVVVLLGLGLAWLALFVVATIMRVWGR